MFDPQPVEIRQPGSGSGSVGERSVVNFPVTLPHARGRRLDTEGFEKLHESRSGYSVQQSGSQYSGSVRRCWLRTSRARCSDDAIRESRRILSICPAIADSIGCRIFSRGRGTITADALGKSSIAIRLSRSLPAGFILLDRGGKVEIRCGSIARPYSEIGFAADRPPIRCSN